MLQYNKLYLFTLFFLLISSFGFSQIQLPTFPASDFSTYYHQRNSFFQEMPTTKDDIAFLGNSITDGAEWTELFQDLHIKNRGISGDTSSGVINRLQEVVDRKPSKIFLLIGTNDLAKNVSKENLINNIFLIADYIKENSPATQVFIQSILPVNDIFGKFEGHTKNNTLINNVNTILKANQSSHHYQYIDLHQFFVDENGKLNPKYTNDGLHLLGKAYLLWKHKIFPFVYNVQDKPSIIPQPQQAIWKNGNFSLVSCKTIVVRDKTLENEAKILQNFLLSLGYDAEISTKIPTQNNYIALGLEKIKTPQNDDEAYKLSVSETQINIVANTAHGIFNAIQTFKQLARDKTMLDTCEITDWPAFSWRGYLVDVGRNYMSIPLLKQQIDVMASNKLNIFHFHATEDIAWRIFIEQYPELVASENMLRNKGMYYSKTEIKELIDYCKERYITFVPEIDMPGHSAAFERSMKTNMQTEEGLKIVKNILKELIDTYHFPYIHIGADEVKITNEKFVPEVVKYIEQFGVKTIGWQPGGNFPDSTIRQLWMDDNAHLSKNDKVQIIDSRHLYINHMDPEEAVVSIYNRKIANVKVGNKKVLGATLCNWPDRAVAQEKDILMMNPVYPSMLAFAERTWQGGGKSEWIANIDDGDKKGFENFENKLLEHKKLYFEYKIFNYAKQSNINWNLYGPFDNKGNGNATFEIEKSLLKDENPTPTKTETGATIVMKHWWAPLIKGAIDEPKENSTWYATTKIWSDTNQERNFWIGFNNISRSPATDSPPVGKWDEKGSAVWVNGNLIPPPNWKRGGMKGNSEIPLLDEGYEYREPTKIPLKKGWNNILIKAPIESFKGKDWQNPVKWMFSFTEI
ncbi:MAG: family 20 glycosylhydrolase [Bacteroidetes bacterium]|nr:family 20 glycosylhydrolase [Bacteroidota bacterium]